LAIDFDGDIFMTLGILVMVFAFTPLFFINHKQKYDNYKVPCYITSGIVTAMLLLGGWLSGNSNAFGQPNAYSGSFLVLCYMIAILFFKPAIKNKTLAIVFSVLMIATTMLPVLIDRVL
jgi:hypothetical protein